MLDRNLGDALLRLDLSAHPEPPTAQIERIIDADRRRVRRWTRISIVLWVLAALGAVWIFVLGGLTFPMIAKMVDAERAESAAAAAEIAAAEKSGESAPRKSNSDARDNPNTSFTVLAKLVAMCMVFGSAAFMVLVFAGLATVILLLRSRSATLRQINANLMVISDQLKRVPPSTQPGVT
jgi:hypothetical protein